ncbi:NAD(P)/FAD-dependent oxidoreductase [Aspergillus affinis]|uniref:NAD(P)/FAD-dependent oxidoreductase n=1 Tax=Aspergillus affinis TaxID=1070780 RepID=UPI0022FE7A00|nr:fructosyl-amino acid oxidase [Aspergillus affinis]KAI9037279.1 fructosyl-amino acid oxidase [Aspergillus affinis]
MTSSPLSLTSSILIVGGGTWGCSTALHLARRGYTNVTVLDPYPIPSPIAAGNDINKIMEHRELKDTETDPKSIMFATCSRAALKGWRTDPIFTPYFHETGSIIAAHTPALIEHIKESEIDPVKDTFTELTTADDFRNTMPPGVLTGPFPTWKGWFSKSGAGWIHAQKAMVAAYTEAQRLGVRFITGSPAGAVESLSYENGDVIGAQTRDGAFHRADQTILAAGATSDRLLDFKNQLRPTAWTLCHIRMTAEEAALYHNLPVLFNVAKGFFMEPDVDHHDLKICDEHPGYCNFIPDPLHNNEIRSVPFAKTQIPKEAEARARAFLRDTMPHLADRELAFARICWDADTPDRAFLIDRHPEHPSLVVAVGGSGNGAMQMPAIGGFIVDALEGKLVREVRDVVRWRPDTAVGRDWRDTQGRFGGLGKVMDFQEIGEDEWTDV